MEGIVDVDVTRLVPEAQSIATRAAAVYLEHTAPWFVGFWPTAAPTKAVISQGVATSTSNFISTPPRLRQQACFPYRCSWPFTAISRRLTHRHFATSNVTCCHAPHREDKRRQYPARIPCWPEDYPLPR